LSVTNGAPFTALSFPAHRHNNCDTLTQECQVKIASPKNLRGARSPKSKYNSCVLRTTNHLLYSELYPPFLPFCGSFLRARDFQTRSIANRILSSFIVPRNLRHARPRASAPGDNQHYSYRNSYKPSSKYSSINSQSIVRSSSDCAHPWLAERLE
jgi:hypothetical protein